jgi:hypothetical protein
MPLQLRWRNYKTTNTKAVNDNHDENVSLKNQFWDKVKLLSLTQLLYVLLMAVSGLRLVIGYLK